MISVLYVDDEPALLEITKLFLERSGDFSIDTIDSADSALKMISLNSYDAIVSDYQMPGTDGLAFLKQLRQSGNPVPFIMFTGRGREEIALEALNSGADFYLQKGGDPKSQFAELSHKINQSVQRKKIEEALKKSEARFREVIETADDLIMIQSPEGKFQYVNPAWRRVLGYTDDEIQQLSITDIISPDEKNGSGIPFKEACESGPGQKIKTRFVTRDGRFIPVEGSCTVDIENGETISIRGIFRDMTGREKTEQELIESKRMLTTLMDNLQGMVYRCKNDPDWTMEFVSGGCFALTGYQPDEILNNRKLAYNDLILPEYRAMVWEKWQEILQQHLTFQGEYPIRTASGEVKWVWEQGRGVFTPAGELLALEGYIADITERKTTENLLRDNERRSREIFNATNEAIFIEDALTGKILDVNQRMPEMYGYDSKEEILSRKIGDLSADTASCSEEEAQQHISRAMRSGPQVFEWLAKKKSGETFWVEVSLRCSSIGGKDRILAVVRDISDRKKLEDTLRRSEDRYKAIFGTQLAGIIIIDASTKKIIEVNPYAAALIGLPAERIVGQVCHRFICPAEEGKCPVLDLGQAVDRAERVLINAAGVQIPIDKSVTCIMQDDHPYLIETFHSITDRKSLEDSLKLMNRKLQILSSAMRHDINNKLTVLSGYTELMKSVISDDKILNYIRSEERALSDIEKILRFTKEYENLGVKTPGWQDVQDSVRRVSGQIHTDQITIRNDTAGLQVFADPMIERVFYNLIDNAVRYGQTATRIQVRHEQHDDGHYIIFEDDGLGICPEEKEKIFARGFGKNTGLGLFISREILAITELEIHETGEYGHGARFEIRVPEGKYKISG
jgi:PAS domain S-box-containing protein